MRAKFQNRAILKKISREDETHSLLHLLHFHHHHLSTTKRSLKPLLYSNLSVTNWIHSKVQPLGKRRGSVTEGRRDDALQQIQKTTGTNKKPFSIYIEVSLNYITNPRRFFLFKTHLKFDWLYECGKKSKHVYRLGQWDRSYISKYLIYFLLQTKK